MGLDPVRKARPNISLCLCMIVRDEAGTIERCLESCRPAIDYWVICDTGSTDRTPELIRGALAGIPGELHRRGRPVPGYLESLRALADRAAPRLRILHHAPVPPDSMVETCAGYDVGLAVVEKYTPSPPVRVTDL